MAMSSRSGMTLVETLAALTVLALAIAGTASCVRMGLNFIASARSEAAAVAVLQTRLDLALPGEGVIEAGGNEIGQWQVERFPLESGRLAGAPVRWEWVEAQVSWSNRGRVRTLSARRVLLLPETGG